MSGQPWKKLQELVQKRKVVIFGLGLQGGGTGVANTLLRAGAQVHVLDEKSAEQLAPSLKQLHKDITFECGKNLQIPDGTELVIKNPAVPAWHNFILQAQEMNIEVTTEAALALRCMRDQAIGITGTRGKTTTTTLIHRILVEAGKNALLCGNIPNQPLLAALEQGRDDSLFVVELSSFQIEGCIAAQVSPHVAVVTNIYPDHLNRYENFDAYADTKAGLFSWQKPGDWAVFSSWENDSEGSSPLEESTRVDSSRDSVASESFSRLEKEVETQVNTKIIGGNDLAFARTLKTPLLGDHNRENIAFALAVSEIFSIPPESVQKTIENFTGVEYRLQNVASREGLTFINDTTSTTPIALQKALEAFSGQRFVLLFGGTTKQLPLSEEFLTRLRDEPLGVVMLQGSGSQQVLQALGEKPKEWMEVTSLEEGVREAIRLAHAKNASTVLFSPGFSSFELFANEFDRGEQFNKLVREP